MYLLYCHGHVFGFQNARRRTAAAVSIQSLYRGHRGREKQVRTVCSFSTQQTPYIPLLSLSLSLSPSPLSPWKYGVFRAQFDNSTAGNDLQSLSRLLIIFYTERKDHSRLVSHIDISCSTSHVRHHHVYTFPFLMYGLLHFGVCYPSNGVLYIYSIVYPPVVTPTAEG